MKRILIILAVLALALTFSTDASAQRNRKKGYDYKAHSQRNQKNAKVNAKRYKASGGDLTKMKCAKKKRSKWTKTKTRSRNGRR